MTEQVDLVRPRKGVKMEFVLTVVLLPAACWCLVFIQSAVVSCRRHLLPGKSIATPSIIDEYKDSRATQRLQPVVYTSTGRLRRDHARGARLCRGGALHNTSHEGVVRSKTTGTRRNFSCRRRDTIPGTWYVLPSFYVQERVCHPSHG